MKITFVELAGFRGCRDKVRLDFPRGFVVLAGRNGVGKSTVLDAFDFVLSGTIDKFAVTAAKGGGLAQHLWWVGEGEAAQSYVSVGFANSLGQELVVTRSRQRGLETNEADIIAHLVDNASLPTPWYDTLVRTTLIRDETIASLSLDLPEQKRVAAVKAALGELAASAHGERTKGILSAAEQASDVQKVVVSACQDELGRTLTQLTEARAVANRESDLVEATKIIRELESDLPETAADLSAMVRGQIAGRKLAIAAMRETLVVLKRLDSPEENEQGAKIELERIASTQLRESAMAELAAAQSRAESARQVLDSERARDALAAHLASLLEHGEALGLSDGHCPLCAVSRTQSEFASAITAARERLRQQGSMSGELLAALHREEAAVREAEDLLYNRTQHLNAIESQLAVRSAERKQLDEQLGSWGIVRTKSTIDGLQELVLRQEEDAARLERALLILETSGARERVSDLENRLGQLRVDLDQNLGRLSSAERAARTAKQIDDAAREVTNQIVTEQFDTVLPLLKELYQRLRPHGDWREIETDFGGRVRASLNFSVGDGKNPQFLFSSGQRRALGIAFLLSLHLSRPWCKLQTLLLDDPVQHIDDYRALNLVEVLAAIRRSGRQVVVAVEDSALADVLCRRLSGTGHDIGRRFDLRTDKTGSIAIESQSEVFPLPTDVLREISA